LALVDSEIQVLDSGDRESDLKELEALKQQPIEEPDSTNPWDRMTKTTIYMGPGEAPELINPEKLYKPDFMEERIEEEPSPPHINRESPDYGTYQEKSE